MSGAEQRALLELNLRRETWCRVEADPREAWQRTERRHFRGLHLRTSPALLGALTAAAPQRGAARAGSLTPPARLPERRHFEESYESHLV